MTLIKHNKNSSIRKHYWLIGNSIDGICCHPHRQRLAQQELIAYLETQFVIDFNASQGEFDFTVYRERPGFGVRLLYGYYLQGPRKDVVAYADYMTADSLGQMVRSGRTFRYYTPARVGLRVNRPVLCIRLP